MNPSADANDANQQDSRHARDYQSYLLRLWREDASAHWRASLQSTATKTTRHFHSVEALLAFLEVQTDADSTTHSDR